LIDAVLKIPAHRRPVYATAAAEPLTVERLLAAMQNARKGSLPKPPPTDVFTIATDLLFGDAKSNRGLATKLEAAMLWFAFDDLMAGVHQNAPETGDWWELSWQVRAGDKARDNADWITEQLGPQVVAGRNASEKAASSSTWPVMLTAAASALAETRPGDAVSADAVIAVAQNPKMRRFAWPRAKRHTEILELASKPVVAMIAQIITDALGNSPLDQEDQLLVLRATAAGVCADLWRTPQVVRGALLPAVEDLRNRKVSLQWMGLQSVAPAAVIGQVLGSRWASSESW